MAARQGEKTVATLFGDVHYFYAPETTKPRHHRFDKGSYVYLFENAGAPRARVEIANHAGTDDQDAFEGFLDKVTLRYSYKHTCLVTLVVGPLSGADEWHLPTYDPRNENKYHYPLHSLDIYFWTRADALQFVSGARRVLPPAQCEILDEPAEVQAQAQDQAPGQNDVSAVVQQLENVAISGNAPSAAPPASGEFAPIPYNPAAPAAPEAIRPREKTPPPPQDPTTDPRAMAVAYEQNQGQGQPFSPAPFSPYFPHHQQQQPLGSPGFAPPPTPPPPGQPLVNPGFAPQGYYHAQFQRTPGIPASPGLLFPGTPGLQSSLASTASPPQGQQAVAPPPPPPQPQPPSQPGHGEYGLHHQTYVLEKPASASSGSVSGLKEGKGRREENAGRLERGVSGMFKKFEKKFG